MSEFSELIKEYLDEKTSMLHTAILGEIKSIDGNAANVKPIQGDLPLLVDLPFLHRSNDYSVGDTVMVVFLERARDGTGNRRHDLSDGVIVGTIGATSLVRDIYTSTDEPTSADGQDGDLWFVYE